MFGAYVLMIEAFRFFAGRQQSEPALHAKRHIDVGWYLFTQRHAVPDLLPNRLSVDGRPGETFELALVVANQAEQKVFGFDLSAAELAGLVPCEEDDPPGRLVVDLEHGVDARRLQRSNDRR